MGTINLAEKYSKKIVDKFYKESVILGKTSKEYEWDGVKSIKVYTINTVAPTNYGIPAAGTYDNASLTRYGNTHEITDTIQTMTITQDKAVSLSVDKGNNTNQMLIKNSGVVMARELREQFVPMFDKYALAQWATNCGQYTVDSSLQKSNIVEAIFSHVTKIRNSLTDINDAFCYVGETDFAKVLLSPEFLHADKLAERNLEKGVMGKVRGMQIVPIPDSYLPEGVNFMTVKKSVVLAPTKIKDAKVHSDPVGVSGALLEVRWMYDAFVLDTRKNGVVVSYKEAPSA